MLFFVRNQPSTSQTKNSCETDTESEPAKYGGYATDGEEAMFELRENEGIPDPRWWKNGSFGLHM